MTVEWYAPQSASINKCGYLADAKVPLFTLDYGLYRNREKPWVLRCLLPYADRAWEVATELEATAIAEEILTRWIEDTGISSQLAQVEADDRTTGKAHE